MFKIPKIFIPILLVVIIFVAVKSSSLLALPSAEYDNPSLTSGAKLSGIEMIVKGVKCRGTSNFFISRLKDSGGIASIKAFAGENRCVIKYDPQQTNPERIKELVEAPYFQAETNQWIEGIFAVTSSKMLQE
ncbi:MAG: hypothetical protein CO189_11595 [candidate division Zixibacteria bacterium CG_4_9_14_3_um_filter_46_8]|nr:MAG: hypothetical protein CO189_11595 [candidate division Zixibacteria bacterium CG_4_9_14_3_um_filter_46_8]